MRDSTHCGVQPAGCVSRPGHAGLGILLLRGGIGSPSTGWVYGLENRGSQNFKGPCSGTGHTAVVDVWRFRLDPLCVSSAQILNWRERRRARSIVSAAAARRFVNGRVRLRQILASYCGLDPHRVPLRHTPRGKPYLPAPFSDIRFNLSHSGGLALLAVSTAAEVGVDLEQRRRIAAGPIAAAWLHDGEQRDLLRRDGNDRAAAFFRLWCRKEAVVKAQGTGLRFPLHQFRVSACARRAVVLAWPGASRWHLYDLPMGQTYTAALALNRPALAIRYRELS